MNEFEIIRQYLTVDKKNRKDVVAGIGDDCALVKVPRGQRLAISMDTLVESVHFLKGSQAIHVAHKAIAVNLSDLAAAGAEPAWLTLSLSIPEFDEEWLKGFHKGLREMADYFHVQIIGGDTTRGPLSVTIQAHGFVPEQQFLRRSTAKAGELICVTGFLGDADIGLKIAKNEIEVTDLEDKSYLLAQHRTPYPRVAAGIALRNKATACIDISDGLLADVLHLSQASDVGALLRWERIPVSEQARSALKEDELMQSVLSGGDDYELCFTINEDDFETARQALEMVGAPCIAIGRLTGKPGVRVMHHKQELDIKNYGFRHF